MDEKKTASGTTDLTTGRPLVRILVFALPLVLGTVFQQLYSFADTVIVGRCLGTDALAAEGVSIAPEQAEEDDSFFLWVGEMELPWLQPEDPKEVVSPANLPEFLERMREMWLLRHEQENICS